MDKENELANEQPEPEEDMTPKPTGTMRMAMFHA